jgi:hypothetical protein
MTVKEDQYDEVKYVTFKQLEQSLIENIALDALRGDNLYNSGLQDYGQSYGRYQQNSNGVVAQYGQEKQHNPNNSS